MLTARNGLGVAVTPDGTLYAVGGQTASTSALTTVESWSPLTNTWSTRTALPRGVWSPGVVTGIDGRVWVVGGRDTNSAATTNVYAFDPTRNAWDTLPAMNISRHSHAIAVAPSGLIYAIGGRTGSTGTITNTAEVYDPTSRLWTALPVIPNGLSSSRAVAGSDGRVWVFGGINNTPSTLVQIYDPVGRSWSFGPSMPTARYGHAVTRVGDTVYIVGGDSSSQLVLLVATLNLSTQQYGSIASLPGGRLYLGLGALLDGRLAAVGGSPNIAASSYLNLVGTYSPLTNTWR
jgi:N-acetylneuraminic acid mutarotase